jgi:hypothetical protein
MKFSVLFPIIFCLIGFSCSTTSLLTSDVRPSEITELQYFEPTSRIYFIKEKNKAVYNDSISKRSQSLQLEILDSLKEKIHLTNVIYWRDSSYSKRLRKEVQTLLDEVWKAQSIDEVKITPLLDSLLEKRNKRFGLITLSNGHTRTKENYKQQMEQGVVLAVATAGLFTKLPVKSNSEIFAIIVDAKLNNLAFYRVSTVTDKDPLNRQVVKDQFKKIFTGYFKMK